MRDEAMKEGDHLFECYLGSADNKWFWFARGYALEEFCRTYDPECLPLQTDGWLVVGPYKAKRAAERDLQRFEDDFTEFLQEKLPGLEIEDAPNPRSLN